MHVKGITGHVELDASHVHITKRGAMSKLRELSIPLDDITSVTVEKGGFSGGWIHFGVDGAASPGKMGEARKDSYAVIFASPAYEEFRRLGQQVDSLRVQPPDERSVDEMEPVDRHAPVPKAKAQSGSAADPHLSKGQARRSKISEVADRSEGDVRCPKCGGTQFKAKRSGRGKVIGVATVGVGAVLAPKSRVKCVTCGTEYRRG